MPGKTGGLGLGTFLGELCEPLRANSSEFVSEFRRDNFEGCGEFARDGLICDSICVRELLRVSVRFIWVLLRVSAGLAIGDCTGIWCGCGTARNVLMSA